MSEEISTAQSASSGPAAGETPASVVDGGAPSASSSGGDVPPASRDGAGSEASELPSSSLMAESATAAPDGEQGEKPEEGSEEKQPQPDQEEGAPESYDTFNFPEGVGAEEGPVLDAFKGVAKELNLSQAQAQAFIDKMAPIMRDKAIDNIRQVSAQWAERSKADAEIGGERMPTTMASINRVLQRFGRGPDGQMDPDIEEFTRLPIGNHPGALKLLARAGSAIGEAKFPTGGVSETPYTAADFYRDASKGGR